MQSTTMRQRSPSPPLHRKKINDEDCLAASLVYVQQIYNVCQFYSDYKIESDHVIVNSNSKFSKTLSYSQMKKKQIVNKSISLYKKTKETYKQKKMTSMASILGNKEGQTTTECKEESKGYFNTAKRIYSNYVPSISPTAFILNHVMSKYFSGNETKPIEKTDLKYKDRSLLNDAEVANVIRFLKSLSKIDTKDQSVNGLMKLFLNEWVKYYNNFVISPKAHSGRQLSLNDMTPLEFMVSLEMWVHRYMTFVYTTIDFVNNVSHQENINDSSSGKLSFDSSRMNSSNSIYSDDTAVQLSNHSLSGYTKTSLNTSSSTIFNPSRTGDVSSAMDETTLFDELELDLSKLDFEDIDESCISPISDTIDLLYPDEKLKTIAIEINTHNHLHCLETIKKRALHYYELPFPYRENKYVINGYRYYDFYDCLKSIFAFIPVMSKPTYKDTHEHDNDDESNECQGNHLYHWHNETVNIWTHLLASFYFLYKLITFKNIYKTTAQNASISAFFLMSFSCFMLSSLWHTFSGWNKVKRRAKACCLDYSGISMLIVSSIIAVQCSIVPLENESFLQLYAWVIISLSLLAMSLILNWHPRFDSPESRNKRILVFVSMAVVGNISIITLNPAKKGFHFFELFKNSFVWYLLGVVFYGGFLPERFRSDCPIGRIPTMDERNKELKLIKEERSVYFKISPYSSSSSSSTSSSTLSLLDKIIVESSDEEVMNKMDQEIDEEIDNSSSSWKSLWWTDYYLQSHNIWHIMVIMGCFGHLKAVETILDNMK
ncbi:hypothetical protein ACO0SA_003264 [Hanseniaspora valbyensis]